MPYSHHEVAVIAAKEIMLGLIAKGENYLLKQGGQLVGGIELATHVGDCFEALFKKVKHAVQET